MTLLANRLEGLLPVWCEERRRLTAEHGEQAIGQVTAAATLGGMRGVPALVCDTSNVDPQRGLIIRGIPVADLVGLGPEAAFWLLLTGELPGALELKSLTDELARRNKLPEYVSRLVAALPADTHPMTVFSMAILSLQQESVHSANYGGTERTELWRAALEDSLRLLALAPLLAALAYGAEAARERPVTPYSDMAARTAQLLGLSPAEEAREMLQLFLLLHSDHESGNVSALSALTVGSTHASPFLAVAAGLCGLAGPIHGLASTGSVEFLRKMGGALGSNLNEGAVEQYCRDWLAQRRLIPGYGHAVLRGEDPRFALLHRFGMQHFPGDELFRLCDLTRRVVPGLLREQGKAANPQPNVDAITGTVLNHYGVARPQFYTVMFGMGLLIGMLAQYVLWRGLGSPLVRPRSLTVKALRAELL